MYGNISSKPTTSYFCYEFFIFVTALLLVFTGCGKDEGGGGRAAAVNSSGGSGNNWGSGGGSTSIPGSIGASAGAAQLEPDASSWLRDIDPQALAALMGLGNIGSSDSAIQDASANIAMLLRVLPALMAQVKDEAQYQNPLIELMKMVAAKYAAQAAKTRQRGQLVAILREIVGLLRQFVNKANKGKKTKGKKD